MCCTNFEYSKVSPEVVNKPFYGFSKYMCNSVEVVIGLTHCPHLPDLLSDKQERDFDGSVIRVKSIFLMPNRHRVSRKCLV